MFSLIYFAGFAKFIKDVVIDKWIAERRKKSAAAPAKNKPDGGKED